MPPRIHYWSSNSGNTTTLAQKLHTPTHRINGDIGAYTILMLPTYEQPKQGDYIPRQVRQWVSRNGIWVIGIIGTGNLSFGYSYCQAAHDLSQCLNVPVLYRCELRGTPQDIRGIDQGIKEHWDTLCRMRQHTPTPTVAHPTT